MSEKNNLPPGTISVTRYDGYSVILDNAVTIKNGLINGSTSWDDWGLIFGGIQNGDIFTPYYPELFAKNDKGNFYAKIYGYDPVTDKCTAYYSSGAVGQVPYPLFYYKDGEKIEILSDGTYYLLEKSIQSDIDPNIKKLTSGVIGLNVADSRVDFDDMSVNSTYTYKGKTIDIGGINYAVANNSTIEMTDIYLNGCYESLMYAYNNSKVVVDDVSVSASMGNKPAFTQDNNSFINFYLSGTVYQNNKYFTGVIYPSILNDGDKYVSFYRDETNLNENDMYLPSRKSGYNTCVVTENDIYVCIPATNNLNDYIKQLNRILSSLPSVLNGKTLRIDLTNIAYMKENVDVLTESIMIHKFYQGTVIVHTGYDVSNLNNYDDIVCVFNYTSINDERVNKNLYNLLTSDERLNDDSKGSIGSIPLIYVKDVDNIIFEGMYLSFWGNSKMKDKADPSVSSLISPAILLNNVKSAEFKSCWFASHFSSKFSNYMSNHIFQCKNLVLFNTNNYFYECFIYAITSKVRITTGNSLWNVPVAIVNNFSETYIDEINMNAENIPHDATEYTENKIERAWIAVNINNSIFSMKTAPSSSVASPTYGISILTDIGSVMNHTHSYFLENNTFNSIVNIDSALPPGTIIPSVCRI